MSRLYRLGMNFVNFKSKLIEISTFGAKYVLSEDEIDRNK